MNSKTTIVLLLLSIFSVYFLCPVLCPSLEIQTCSVYAVSQPQNQVVAAASQFSETQSNSSTCCRSEKSETTPGNDPGEENDTCCFDHLEIFKTIEYQRASQSLEQPISSVAVISSFETNTFPAHSTVVLDRYPVPILDSPTYQISPRAPPFTLVYLQYL